MQISKAAFQYQESRLYSGLTDVTGHIIQNYKKYRGTNGFDDRFRLAASAADAVGAVEILLFRCEMVSDAVSCRDLTVRLTVLLRRGTATGTVSDISIEQDLGTHYCQQFFLQYSPVQPGVWLGLKMQLVRSQRCYNALSAAVLRMVPMNGDVRPDQANMTSLG